MRKLVVFCILVLAVHVLAFAEPAFADSPAVDPTGKTTTPSGPIQTTGGSGAATAKTASSDAESPAEVTAAKNASSPIDAAPLPKQEDFIAAVRNEDSGSVMGVYVPQVLAFKVVQQPAANPVYVSENAADVTQFRFAAQYGTTGLIAHNFLAGASFFKLSIGQQVDIVYGDGTVRRYAVSKIRRFQAVRPEDPFSSFLDLDNGGSKISSTEVFNQVYSAGNRVVLQTCIDENNNPSWGRLFVIALPIS